MATLKRKLGYAKSAGTGALTHTSLNAYAAVTGTSLTITCHGGPIVLALEPYDISNPAAHFTGERAVNSTLANMYQQIALFRNGVHIEGDSLIFNNGNEARARQMHTWTDEPGPGKHVYQLYAATSTNPSLFSYVRLVARELDVEL